MKTFDYSIIGAGIVGLSLAFRLRQKFRESSIAVFEKETSAGAHASGRNSGVLHSGIYYPARTLKAQVCQAGARALEEFCLEQRIRFKRCGKVVLPTRAEDTALLELLMNRGKENGVESRLLDRYELRQIEPLAHSITGQALYVPFTAIFDPKAVLSKLVEILQAQNVNFFWGSSVNRLNRVDRILETKTDHFSAGHIFNAAGMQADIFSTQCEIYDWCLFPFKGIYHRLQFPKKFNCLVYPAPDLRMPFLGTHFTMNFEDQVTLGPSALPAFGRENYKGLSGIDWATMPRFAWMLLSQYLKNEQGFRHFTHRELSMLRLNRQLKEARLMVPSLSRQDFTGQKKVGIRAQLFNLKKKQLETDFVVVNQPQVTHVLNAVSPGFTSALAFADRVIEKGLEIKTEELSLNR